MNEEDDADAGTATTMPPARVKIVIESDAVDIPAEVLRSIVVDAVQAIHGRISVTSTALFVNGAAVEAGP